MIGARLRHLKGELEQRRFAEKPSLTLPSDFHGRNTAFFICSSHRSAHGMKPNVVLVKALLAFAAPNGAKIKATAYHPSPIRLSTEWVASQFFDGNGHLVYFDRVQFKGMRVNRTYPTIVGWSAELARKRGDSVPRISKPADIAAATSGQTDQPPVAALNIPSSSVDKVAGILQKLASTVREFDEAMAETGKQGAPVNVMRKTFSGLSNMLNVASTIEATATPTSSQLDDIFFGSESFTTAVDALNFYERMTYEIDRLENLDINDADLIFFLVLRHGHYFLICINVKASKLEIIDNKSLVSGVTMKDKYGDCTTLLVTALKEYLALGSSALFWKVDELTEEVVDMSWKESENYIDCGLFVMRHMETYKGTLKKWNPGFKKKAKLNEEFLIGLRARYAATIIKWSANILKNVVIKKTKLLYNKK
nr:uncharacterized protein LOC109158392 [Ipomoea batatas]